MFVHGWIDDEHRFRGTKYTVPAMREIFRDQEAISIETGQRLAMWASGKVRVEAPLDPGLLVKAREWAETGLPKYQEFWKGLTPEQRRQIGEAEHAEFKAIAHGVPQ
jgi:hypothetical protein